MDDTVYIEPNEYESPLNLKSTQAKNPPTSANQNDGEKEVSSKDNSLPKYLSVLIVVTVILLVSLLLVLIAVTVATYTLLSSEHLKVIELEKTQDLLFTTQTNISQTLTQLDAKLHVTTFLSVSKIAQSQTQCGPGLWYPLIYLNMSDPSQQCPSVWREYNTSGVRACGRPVSSAGSCPAIGIVTHIQYSRVCGRVIGFQYATPDAFNLPRDSTTDFDGIDITHGVQHNHIWSYVAAAFSSQKSPKCPCVGNEVEGVEPSNFFHDNYYCESGNPNPSFMHKLYTDDPLWDGQQCEGTCCNGTNSPPWFSVQLPAPTTDGVEVRICCNQGTDDEDVPVQLIEIYLQ